ncbi:MAG: hypothetical protein P4M14_05965 [Gammaproteobacteria bacterium]|nr:hypothetical protein [Gammaproteobacteria bacterium]
MSISHANLALVETHIPIPIVDNDDLNTLIIAINDHISKAGPDKSDNQQKIAALAQTLKFLSAETASPERSVKIHTAMMNTYLIDGFVEQRKKIKKGEPSIRTSLSAAIMEFQANTQSRLFVGHVGIDTKREDLVETQIMHSVCSQREARELTESCYKRTIEAFVAGIIDDKKMAEAQRIYLNAKRVVIEIEDKFKTSSHLWNTLMDQNNLGMNRASGALMIPTQGGQDNREKHSLESVFDQNKKYIIDALNVSFYPAVLISLLSLPPKDEKKPLSEQDKAKLDELKQVLEEIQNKYKPVSGNENQIQIEIYKAIMQRYVDAYIHQIKKDGRKLDKGPLLSHLEDTLKIFHDKTKNDMFYGKGDKAHDKILGSIDTKENDSSVFRTEKYLFLREMAQYAFNAAIVEGLQSDTPKSQDHFVYAYKTTEKMGQLAKMELNKAATKAVSNMAPEAVVDPKSRSKDMKKAAEREEKLGKKFINFLVIRDNVEIKEADLRELFDVAKATPRLMRALQSYQPLMAQQANAAAASHRRAPSAEVSERKQDSPVAASQSSLSNSPQPETLSQFAAHRTSPRHSIFAKQSGSSTATTATSSAAATANNSRRASEDEGPSNQRVSTEEQKFSEPNPLDAGGQPKPFLGTAEPVKIHVPKIESPAAKVAKTPAAFTFTEIMANLHEKVRAAVDSPSSTRSPTTPQSGHRRKSSKG